MPGQLYHLSDGRTVQLIGTVDRADEWVEEDGTRWVRVVDYKTGTKKLDLKEVYCGLDCQMLLYLFSLTRDPSGRFTGAEPAGVLYLLADPAPETTTREKAARSVEYQLDGLVRDEQKVFDAMDADETGRYLPFGYRNGAPSPYQKDKRADIAKLNRIRLHLDDLVTRMGSSCTAGRSLPNRWWSAPTAAPVPGAIMILSAAMRPASGNGAWKPRQSPLSRKQQRMRRNRHERTQMDACPACRHRRPGRGAAGECGGRQRQNGGADRARCAPHHRPGAPGGR